MHVKYKILLLIMHANIPENINPFSPVFIGTDSKLQKISVRSSVCSSRVQERATQDMVIHQQYVKHKTTIRGGKSAL